MLFRLTLFVTILFISKSITAQQFGPEPTIFTQASGVSSVYTADLDGDGDMDVLSALQYVDKIVWYENQGEGLFTELQIISEQADLANSVRAADLDGDGDLDVLSASGNDDKIAWYENLGEGLFGDQQIITVQAQGAFSVHTSDLDGDGDLDVLSASPWDNKIAWYENQGGGMFGAQMIISTEANGARAVITADLDNDGDMDVISGSYLYEDKIAWYENQGEGNFGEQQIISTEIDHVLSVGTADLDNDGDMDVLSASREDDKIAWYENQGGGIFGDQQIISNQAEGAVDVITADLDNDGDNDVISASFWDNKVAWYENSGGQFSEEQIISYQAEGASSIHPADVDGDGNLDLFSASKIDDKVAWYENQGEGLFGEQLVISDQADQPHSVYSGDLDGDGDIDVLFASLSDDKIAWYENLGNGLYDEQQLISDQADGAFSVYADDLDNDGDMDVLSASFFDDKIAWYENQGSGLFSQQQIISTQAQSPRDIHTADLDGDGDMDVLSASANDDKIAWYENLGDGSFGEQQIISTEAEGAESVKTADIDGDGDIDVLSASYYDDKIAWYENQGGGIFGSQQIISIEVNGAYAIDAGDLDGDGDIDVLSASLSDGQISWFEHIGPVLFSEQQVISSQAQGACFVYSADLDNDGNLDVLSASISDDKIAWYKNLGEGLFSEQQIITEDADGARSVHAADLDGDGDKDVLSTSSDDDKIAWYENLISDGCTDPSACNYDPDAWIENNSCCYECGCTVAGANNYSASACFDDGSCRFKVYGVVFFDENENGLMDEGESGLPLQEVNLIPDDLTLITNNDGIFIANASGSDEYTFILPENPQFPFFTTPDSLTFDGTQDNWNQDTLFFGLSNEFPDFDLQADLYSVIGGFPCNDERDYYLCFRNTSNVPIDIQVEFHYDSLFQDILENPNIDSLGLNVAYLSFTGMAPQELICAELALLSPTVEFIGEYLDASLSIQAFYEGEEVAFDADSLSEELTCAYDPNDKHVFPAGYSEAHYIVNDTTLEYLIRFQNTGNAPATDVIIRDTIDDNLNLNSFQLIAHSHSVFTTVYPETREVEIFFQDIMLADSVNNEPESHGFVSFNIRPEDELPLLTELHNTAGIYFDNNPPIITNTTWSTIYDCSLFEVSFTDEGALLIASEGDHYQWFLNGEPIEGANEQEYVALVDGNYSVQVDIDFPCSVLSGSTFITVTSVQEWEGREIKLFPNPMTNTAVLDLGEFQGSIQLEIYDLLGKIQRFRRIVIESGILNLERGNLSSGTYILRLIYNDETMELKFVVD